MLLINPDVVRFGTSVWEDVVALHVDRSPEHTVVEHDDRGSHAVLVDVPEQRTLVRIVRDVDGDDMESPIPGDRDTLVFYTSPTGSDARRRRITATCVVTAVRHELAGGRTARRTVSLIAVSPTGDADPLTIEDAAP